MAAAGGRKSELAGYYFHLDAHKSFISGGMYCPNKDILKKVRKSIDVDFEKLQKIVSEKNFKKYFGKMHSFGEKLSKVPQGFSTDSPAAEWLKFKHFAIEYALDDKTLLSHNFIDNTTEIFKAMKNFNAFFNEIIRN
jgi:uncharacterized protein (TIGR02453 family)